MTIIAQPRRRFATNLRIAIWSAFLLAVLAPPLFERTGHPSYGAILLRPGASILSRIDPAGASGRGVVLANFCFYLLLIYLLLRLLRKNSPAA
jgi:hypothetical protein